MQFTKSMEDELLTQNMVESVLNSRVSELNAILEIKLKSLKKMPEGSLRVSTSNGCVQYYYRASSSDVCGTYIPKKNFKLAKKLAQKEYDFSLVETLQKELQFLTKILAFYKKSYSKNSLAATVLHKFTKEKIALINPIRLSEKNFSKLWSSVQYKGKSFSQNQPELFTAKGERVRSKSEIIIADTLHRLKIPYRYEFPIELKNESGKLKTFHPDFICLNLKTRQEFLWEHFGMMDEADYASSSLRKLRIYEKNGIFPGKNLIITMETSDLPISAKQIERIASQFLELGE